MVETLQDHPTTPGVMNLLTPLRNGANADVFNRNDKRPVICRSSLERRVALLPSQPRPPETVHSSQTDYVENVLICIGLVLTSQALRT